jgi:hypothetical protein
MYGITGTARTGRRRFAPLALLAVAILTTGCAAHIAGSPFPVAALPTLPTDPTADTVTTPPCDPGKLIGCLMAVPTDAQLMTDSEAPNGALTPKQYADDFFGPETEQDVMSGLSGYGVISIVHLGVARDIDQDLADVVLLDFGSDQSAIGWSSSDDSEDLADPEDYQQITVPPAVAAAAAGLQMFSSPAPDKDGYLETDAYGSYGTVALEVFVETKDSPDVARVSAWLEQQAAPLAGLR